MEYQITEEDKVGISDLNEYESYFFIDECGAFIWRMSHDMSHGRIPESSEIRNDIQKVAALQRFVVGTLTRFGIDPETAKDKPNGDYWKWFTFWDNWKKGLTDQEWNELNRKLENKESVEDMLPFGNWKNNRIKLESNE